ncbi:MAG: FAD-dependent oxidoreductase, partial [Anaerolineales bacterium]|nr:FAD-dependent oxidoreductase [Anaerolineales bacterium]
MQKEKIVIIGSGPAGMTAALYAGRSNLEPVVIAGMVIGGQISITAEVENYIGFPEGTTGPELVEKMQKHAEHFGARFVFDEVTEVDFSKGSPFYVKTHGEEYLADSVIITAGASARLLEVPGEKELTGRGVSYCATCDGFFFFFKEVVVVGGGDSALEEGIFLTKFANTVTIIHRRDELRAGNFLQERAHANPKIKFIWDTVVEEIKGSAAVESITLRNRKTDEVSEMKVDG